jgi:hypothetical protein
MIYLRIGSWMHYTGIHIKKKIALESYRQDIPLVNLNLLTLSP